jgi:hypothetical protein
LIQIYSNLPAVIDYNTPGMDLPLDKDRIVLLNIPNCKAVDLLEGKSEERVQLVEAVEA